MGNQKVCLNEMDATMEGYAGLFLLMGIFPRGVYLFFLIILNARCNGPASRGGLRMPSPWPSGQSTLLRSRVPPFLGGVGRESRPPLWVRVTKLLGFPTTSGGTTPTLFLR